MPRNTETDFEVPSFTTREESKYDYNSIDPASRHAHHRRSRRASRNHDRSVDEEKGSGENLREEKQRGEKMSSSSMFEAREVVDPNRVDSRKGKHRDAPTRRSASKDDHTGPKNTVESAFRTDEHGDAPTQGSSSKDSNAGQNSVDSTIRKEKVGDSPTQRRASRDAHAGQKNAVGSARRKEKHKDAPTQRSASKDTHAGQNTVDSTFYKEKHRDARPQRNASKDAHAGQNNTMESALQNPSYIRRTVTNNGEEGKKRPLRYAAERMPEVHFIGELIGGSGFNNGQAAISCQWMIEWGRNWSFLSGEYMGQSQYSCGVAGNLIVWNHPIDVHFASASIQGWPRLVLKVWEVDEYGRTTLAGYGFTHLPTNPGSVSLDVACWKCKGRNIKEDMQAFFLGASPQLTNDAVLFKRAWEDRCRLVTVPSGKVRSVGYH